MKTRMSRVCAVALVGLLGSSSLLIRAGETELGITGGVFLPDEDLSGKPENISEVEPTSGIRVGHLFRNRLGWFFDGTFASINTVGFDDADLLVARTGVEVFLRPHRERHAFFASVGAGRLEVDLARGSSFGRSLASVGFGQRLELDGRARMRWELRWDTTLSDEGLGGEDLTMPQFLVSLTWRLGGRRDADGDGVADGSDACPDTPRGAGVDARGCPLDGDGDGVWDGIDRCPDTPRGAEVDARGCPLDGDGDGVWDGIDRCPDTPRGAEVDARGCPLDGDGDGVWDGIDRCPDTPRGAEVDARGCPLDGDGDGVWDGIDRCPDTPRGARVDARGCPLDGDGDGVWDGIDRCPDTARGTAVGTDGCPRSAALFGAGKKTLVLEGVFFELDSDRLTPESRTTLDGVARSLVDWPEVRVEIGGHTDSSGTDAHNLDLSARRAEAVKRYLVEHGVADERLGSRGYGESRPIEDNGTDAGRAKNRRVELRRLDGP